MASGDKSKKLADAVRRLLKIVEELADEYPKKRFTLDGRLVGDLGEVLAEIHYDLELFDTQRAWNEGRL